MNPECMSAAATFVNNLQDNRQVSHITLPVRNGCVIPNTKGKAGSTKCRKNKFINNHNYSIKDSVNDSINKVDLMNLNVKDLVDGQYDHALINVPPLSDEERIREREGNLYQYGIKFEDRQVRLIHAIKRSNDVGVFRKFLQACGVDYDAPPNLFYGLMSLDGTFTNLCFDAYHRLFTMEWHTRTDDARMYGDFVPYLYYALSFAKLRYLGCTTHAYQFQIQEFCLDQQASAIYYMAFWLGNDQVDFECATCITTLILRVFFGFLTSNVGLHSNIWSLYPIDDGFCPKTCISRLCDMLYTLFQNSLINEPIIDVDGEAGVATAVKCDLKSPSLLRDDESYDVFDYGTATKVVSMLLHLCPDLNMQMRLFTCKDKLSKLSLIASSHIAMKTYTHIISRLFVEYADLFSRVGVYGFSFVKLNANAHNGILGKELVASFDSPLSYYVSDFHTDKIIYLVLGGPNLMTRKMLDIYVRMDNDDSKMSKMALSHLRNLVAKLITTDLSNAGSISATVSDSRVRHNFDTPFVKADDNTRHVTLRRNIRNISGPLLDSAGVINESRLSLYRIFLTNKNLLIPVGGLRLNVVVRFVNTYDGQHELIAYVLPSIILTLSDLLFVENNVNTLNRPLPFDDMIV